MKKKIFITLCIIVLLFSCKTTPPAPKIEGLETSSSFMQANIPLISEYSLDNGIKVIVKKQDTNRVFTMRRPCPYTTRKRRLGIFNPKYDAARFTKIFL